MPKPTPAHAAVEELRAARLREHEHQLVEHFDPDARREELLRARERLLAAVLETPLYGALLDYLNAQRATAERARTVLRIVERDGLPIDSLTANLAHAVVPVDVAVVAENAVNEELRRREEQRRVDAEAERIAYVES